MLGHEGLDSPRGGLEECSVEWLRVAPIGHVPESESTEYRCRCGVWFMPHFPRLALGPIQPGVDARPLQWALLESLRQRGLHVQSFLSRACFLDFSEQATVTGVNPRHLDSWLMSPPVCRRTFASAVANADIAVVCGTFVPTAESGGRLDRLCDWLSLPRLGILDVNHPEHQVEPGLLNSLDGLLLVGVAQGADHFSQWAAKIESRWGVPVLGGLGEIPALDVEIAGMSAGMRPSRSLCVGLASALQKTTDLDRLLSLADSVEGLDPAACLPVSGSVRGRVVIAVAYDEAFSLYFPDMLDALESAGAEIVDFSPLRDERLPAETDIVYLGCGHPERHASALSHNHCMKLALRSHVCHGGRLYAEAGGLAYLCQQMETADQGQFRMAGIFPAVAILDPAPREPESAAVILDRWTWLGGPGVLLRGYRNRRWRFESVGSMLRCAVSPQGRQDLVGGGPAVGSCLHLDFALQADLLRGFLHTSPRVAYRPDPWTTILPNCS